MAGAGQDFEKLWPADTRLWNLCDQQWHRYRRGRRNCRGAADDGEVVFADRFGGQGNLVIIDHKNGFFTVYAYNSSILVSVGAKVKRGQTIARRGSTGSATEPSLHFELRKDGKSINPVPYLE